MNSNIRGFYYYFMQVISRIIPFRRWRKQVFYLAYLGSFKNLCEQRRTCKNYRVMVRKYKEYKKTRQAKMAYYSCFTGGYDTPPKLKFFDIDCDYILFVENPELYDADEYVWEFRPLCFNGADTIRNARYHKIMVQDVLPEYKETVWMDSNIDFVSPLFFEDIARIRGAGITFAISTHSGRDCLYEEARMCIEMGKDKPETIEAECAYMKEQGFPEHYGLYETNLMYRNLNDLTLPKIMETWWQMVRDFSRRDQLSQMYAVWKEQGTYPQPLNRISYRQLHGDVLVAKHLKKRRKVK